ncbi:hypothetical protein [uncultured Roseobacter sp.]|uniref:hypothetical protein n=1 Tax=uncultured Roseobacter sp. TaxID=114847 RepID=UPI002611F888|nr:hypothetical protein [uncultured Roseobacter sp.]
MKKGSDAKKQAVRTFVEGFREMFAAKAVRRQAPATDLGELIDLLRAANWSVKERTTPSPATIPGLGI